MQYSNFKIYKAGMINVRIQIKERSPLNVSTVIQNLRKHCVLILKSYTYLVSTRKEEIFKMQSMKALFDLNRNFGKSHNFLG